MLSPFDYRSYHILAAIGGDELTASEVANKYNRFVDAEAEDRSRNRRITSQNVGVVMCKRLIPTYVEVRGMRGVPRVDRPHKSGMSVRVYGLTRVGEDWVERYAYRWEE